MRSGRNSHAGVRLLDIAEKAGVSVNTVSRALTGKADVSPSTRMRVQEIARRMNYSANTVARSLVQGRTNTVGLIVTDCTDPYYAGLIRAIEDATSRKGFGLLLATSNEDSEKERNALFMLRERRVDGLMLTAVDVNAGHVRQLLDQDTPVVLLSRSPPNYAGSFVGIDNMEGAALAVRHLFDLGHRNIVHIGRNKPASSGVERRLGFETAMKALGLACASDRVLYVPPTSEGGLNAIPWLLSLDPRPTAVFTYNDSQAIGAMKGLRNAGVTVPGEMSVVGFDDIAMASLVDPALTTVAQPIERIGTRGAEILINRINGEDVQDVSVVLPATLITRQTTAPPTGDRHR